MYQSTPVCTRRGYRLPTGHRRNRASEDLLEGHFQARVNGVLDPLDEWDLLPNESSRYSTGLQKRDLNIQEKMVKTPEPLCSRRRFVKVKPPWYDWSGTLRPVSLALVPTESVEREMCIRFAIGFVSIFSSGHGHNFDQPTVRVRLEDGSLRGIAAFYAFRLESNEKMVSMGGRDAAPASSLWVIRTAILRRAPMYPERVSGGGTENETNMPFSKTTYHVSSFTPPEAFDLVSYNTSSAPTARRPPRVLQDVDVVITNSRYTLVRVVEMLRMSPSGDDAGKKNGAGREKA
ncbi:hypothetical protein BKA70DRAFT_1540217 [Coprinopsis sp. MPI-PUGE-AT-0042]|nr:hypothetical protein BKA70DRAFT_1540217 [Coprinopsis sp. MPI-PUGE-AT-0042]